MVCVQLIKMGFGISNALLFNLYLFSLVSWFGTNNNAAADGAIVRRNKIIGAIDPTRVTQLSWTPRAFLYKGFLSDEECHYLISLAMGKLHKSTVVSNKSGKSIMSQARTSSSMFINTEESWPWPSSFYFHHARQVMRSELRINMESLLCFLLLLLKDETVASIEERIAAWTFLPKENGESIQVLHYEYGEKYDAHVDYFYDKLNGGNGGHRVATVLMYLSNVEKGGETVFPKAEHKVTQSEDENWSECARKGYAVKPMKGDALLFFNLHINTTADINSLHGGCPVIEGEKWSATKWVHVRKFGKKPVKRDRTRECTEKNVHCPLWAASGECQRNPTFMVGSEGGEGHCRKSCKAC